MDVNTFTYDHMERLLTTSLSHDGADAVTLSSNTYDAVGRLASCAVNDGGSTYQRDGSSGMLTMR